MRLTAHASRGVAAAATVVFLVGCGVVEDYVDTAAPWPTTTPPAVPATGAPAPDGPTATSVPGEVGPDDVPTASFVSHAGQQYRVVEVDLERFDVRVDWDPESDGQMLADVVAADPSIVAATNGGIFTPEFAPGGLLVSDGEVLRGLNLAEGGGNFHLLPNGVFGVRDDGTAFVVDSTAYDGAGVAFATQSGPALLLDGQVHPAFNEGSANILWRNGVGVSPDGRTVYLALSEDPTNFYDFATMFRDELGVNDALFLDGQISDLWVAGDAEPSPFYGPFAGIITVRPAG